MSFLVVAVLALLWLGFFLPSYLQTRESSSPYLSATTFQESLRRLGEQRPGAPAQTQPQAPSGRRRGSAASARRRDILAALSGLVVGTSLLAVSFQGWLLWAPVPAGAAFLGYVALLRLQVVQRRRARRGSGSVPASAVLRPVPAEDGVVLSVRRRAAGDPAGGAAAADAAPEPLERIAG